MSELNIDEIRARAERYTCATGGNWPVLAHRLAGDVPALVAEVERLRAKLAAPCGSCHPCTEYADETWRAAGRRPPHVSEWNDLRAEVQRLRAELAGESGG